MNIYLFNKYYLVIILDIYSLFSFGIDIALNK